MAAAKGLYLIPITQSFPLVGVSILLGCYNKIPQTGWLMNDISLLLPILEMGKSKRKVQARVSAKGLRPSCLIGSGASGWVLTPRGWEALAGSLGSSFQGHQSHSLITAQSPTF